MKKILAIIILSVCALCAQAKIVAKSSGSQGSVLLLDEKCDDTLPKGNKLLVISHSAEKLGDGCWLRVGGDIYLVSQKLGQAVIPEDSFEWVVNETTRPSNS